MLKKISHIAFISCFLYASAGHAQNFNKAKADSLFDAVQANNKGMMSVAIMKDGAPIYSRVTGNSWLGEKNIKANLGTKYRVGSVSKMFTAAMIFQLIEDKKLTLDTKLSAYYPQIPNADKITIGQLLNHSSGVHSITSDADYTTWLNQPQTEAQLVGRMVKNSEFEPGSKHVYSNSNFILLGYIIEKLDKRPYAASLKARITGKLKLNDTYYGGKISADRNEAFSYKWVDNAWQPDTETDMSIPGGAGAVVSTPRDLTVFMNGLFDGKLVSKANLAQMSTMKDGYGMNLFEFKFDKYTAYGHTGSIDGFRSQAAYFPAEGIAISYVANGVNSNINNYMVGLLSILFNKPYQIPDLRSVAISAELLDKYAGNYASTEMPLKITITKNGSVLMAQATGQPAFPLDAAGDHQFKFEPSGIVLVFDPAAGKMLLKQGGRTFNYQKEK